MNPMTTLRAITFALMLGGAPLLAAHGQSTKISQTDPMKDTSATETASPLEQGDSGITGLFVEGAEGRRRIHIDPRAVTRLDQRVESRVESRLQNRIDREYSPEMTSEKAFRRASKKSEQARELPEV